MDAAPLLTRVAQLLDRHGLEPVLIGNAAPALQGAPVTTAAGLADVAVLPILEKVLEEATRQQKGQAGRSQERE